MRHAPRWVGWVTVFAALHGCTPGGGDADPAKDRPDAGHAEHAGGLRVDVGGKALALGETAPPSLTTQQLRAEVGRMLAQQRAASAGQWVKRYPEVAAAALREAASVRVDPSITRFMAERHDEQACVGAGSGWSAAARALVERPSEFVEYGRRRAELWKLATQGKADEAAAIDVAAALPARAPAALVLEAWNVRGMAWLLRGDAAQAAEAWRRSVEAAGDALPYERGQALLLLSNALRRSGKREESIAAWREGVGAVAALVSPPRGLGDAIFWERAAFLRPSDTPWPEPVAAALRGVVERAGTEGALAGDPTPAPAVDAWVWAAVGHWRLAQQRPQAALASLKRAEALVEDEGLRQHLRLHQARSLAQMGQDGAATALLTSIAQSQRPEARAAMATLGTLHLERGQTVRGVGLLRRALDLPGDAPWPGRAEAQADLALGLLALGEDEEGLRLLRLAQKAFESDDPPALLKALRNEAAYHEQTGRSEEGERARSRLAALELAGR